MVYTCKPEKIAIYINKNCKKSLSQIKAETGADIAINGGLYTYPNTPVCHLKADGKIYAKDQWTYFGYGWNDNDIELVSDYSDKENYICCVCLVYKGKKQELIYPAEMGGARQRTMIGLYPNGQVFIYASTEPKTPESLQNYCLTLGLDSAVMLDGGGSTQGYCPNGSVYSSRNVHNYILFWLKDPCPYQEPTSYLSKGSKGEGVKWLQWHLNKHGASLDVDGKFGGLTRAAVVTFQMDNPPLVADGIVGEYTRRKLKIYGAQDEIIRPNYKWASSLATRAYTLYIVLHHAAANGSPENIHEYHESLGWAGIGYNLYVRKDGRIYEGRPIDKIGAHTAGYNSCSVGICFEGNFENEQMSDVQIAAGRKALNYVRQMYPSATVKRHKDLDATACPGRNFPWEAIVN